VRESKPEILIPFAGNSRSPLARVVRSRHYSLIQRIAVQGMDTTSIPETLLTLGLTHPPSMIERWVDDLMARNRLGASDFDPIFARLTDARFRGLKALRGIVGSRDEDAYQPPTSELERLLYGLLDLTELPRYSRQVPIEYDQLQTTVDAYIEDWRIIVEGDGRRWHTRKTDFDRDRSRDNAAAGKGIQVIRFTYRMLKDDPQGCVNTLLHAGQWR
jgi:very-short-patch-repair endonuclease